MEDTIWIEPKYGEPLKVEKSKIKKFIYKYKGKEYHSNMLEFEQEILEIWRIHYFFVSKKCPILNAEIRNWNILFIEVSDISAPKT